MAYNVKIIQTKNYIEVYTYSMPVFQEIISKMIKLIMINK